MTIPTYCQFTHDRGRVFKCQTCGYKWTSRRDDDATPVRLCGPVGTHAKRRRGPGDVLHRLIIRRFGEDYRTGCGCESFVAEMNRNGPEWCREHAGEIAAKMQTEAEKRGWKLAKLRWPTKKFCLVLVLAAIRKTENEAAMFTAQTASPTDGL